MLKNRYIQYLLLIFFICGAAFSQSLMLKANIGVCACWDVIGMNVAEVTNLRIGTVSIIINSCCILIQLCILGRKFQVYRWLQLGVNFLYGIVMNFAYYNIFIFDVKSFAFKVILWLIAIVGLGIFCGGMTALDLVATPVETTCYVISERFSVSFAKARWSFDIVAIASSLLTSILFGLSFKFREGTIGGMLLLGPIEAVVIKKLALKFHPDMVKYT